MEQTDEYDEYLELKKNFDAFKNLYAMVLNDSITLEKRLRLKLYIAIIWLTASTTMLLIALYKIYFIGC